MAIEIAPEDIKPPESRSIRRERGTFRRLAAWGGAAAIAVAVLAVISQTESGSERIQALIGRVIQFKSATAKVDTAPRVVGINPDNVRLEAQVRVLTADRDRLAARLAAVEHNLDDMTGSIKKQNAAAEALKPDAPKSPAPAIIAPLAMPAASEPAGAWPGSTPLQSAATAAQASEPVPLPPIRMAAAPATEAKDETPRKAELGIDLGGASSLEVLNARWMAVKANFGPLLGGLSPLAAPDHRPGMMPYRLVVGPVPNAAAAAALCARFAASRVTCRTTKFDGEKIAQR